MVLAATALAILVVMGLALLRSVLGPSIYDRVLGVNMVGTKTVLLISVLALMWGRSGPAAPPTFPAPSPETSNSPGSRPHGSRSLETLRGWCSN